MKAVIAAVQWTSFVRNVNFDTFCEQNGFDIIIDYRSTVLVRMKGAYLII